MADLTQLQTWLSEALTARHKLMTGTKTVTLASGDRSVTYTQVNIEQLNGYISDLNGQIAAAGGSCAGRRSAIGVVV